MAQAQGRKEALDYLVAEGYGKVEGGEFTANLEAAILATLTAHRRGQEASQIVAPGARDTSNWKWLSRWERLQR